MNYEKYENKLEFPKGHAKPYLKREDQHDVEKVEAYAKELKKYKDETPAYMEARRKYSEETERLTVLFEVDALREVGLTFGPNHEAHPAAQRAFDYAWEQGHAYGYSEVFNHLLQIAEVILG